MLTVCPPLMTDYIIRRLLLIPVTLLGVMAVNFFIVQFAPGGPVETLVAQLEGIELNLSDRFAPLGGQDDPGTTDDNETLGQQILSSPQLDGYHGAQGLDAVTLQKSFECFDFTQNSVVMFFNMLWDYVRFDFCESFFRNDPVFVIIGEAIPVSLSLSFFGFIFTFLICIPLGIWKSRRDGSRLDNWSTTGLITLDAVPGFLVAILALMFLAAKFGWFPIGGLVSQNWDDFPWWRKIIDYFHHIALPVMVTLIGGYSVLTLFVKNSYIDQIRRPYVMTARAKGLSERQIMQNHVFRNAMILVIASIPGALFGLFFNGAVLIEKIFSIPGMGLLFLDAIARRDFPIMFATTFIFGLIGLLMHLLNDVIYTIVDPRINFEGR